MSRLKTGSVCLHSNLRPDRRHPVAAGAFDRLITWRRRRQGRGVYSGFSSWAFEGRRCRRGHRTLPNSRDGMKTLSGAGSRLTPESTMALPHRPVVRARIDTATGSDGKRTSDCPDVCSMRHEGNGHAKRAGSDALSEHARGDTVWLALLESVGREARFIRLGTDALASQTISRSRAGGDRAATFRSPVPLDLRPR
jgi:hypothetical protein